MKIKFILPALLEASHPFWRPIKYSLFPPLGLATLAAYLNPEDEASIVDEHVEKLNWHDEPDIVAIEVYITNAYRAYEIADHYRNKGVFVILGGVHVTSLPQEAAPHADVIFTGPAEESFPRFLQDWRKGRWEKVYQSRERTLATLPSLRRDLIKRHLYLVPNSIVVSRGCPHHCSFCYKDDFYKNGKSFYTWPLEQALEDIESLPGKHLYFLDDHLFGHPAYIKQLFEEIKSQKRVFQGATTVASILKGETVEIAAEAGLKSLFIGFETLQKENLTATGKRHNQVYQYQEAIRRLHDLGILINGSFVFGLDHDDPDVFSRTVDWAVKMGITTATFHILTPYPGTPLFYQLRNQNRIKTMNWNLYNTREVVFVPKNMSHRQLLEGYGSAYREFYQWKNIWNAAANQTSWQQQLKHLAFAGAWKKMEPIWNFLIKVHMLSPLRPLMEETLNDRRRQSADSRSFKNKKENNQIFNSYEKSYAIDKIG